MKTTIMLVLSALVTGCMTTDLATFDTSDTGSFLETRRVKHATTMLIELRKCGGYDRIAEFEAFYDVYRQKYPEYTSKYFVSEYPDSIGRIGSPMRLMMKPSCEAFMDIADDMLDDQ